ncbi:large subunit ribosomal protein L26e [Pancytospora philotis]|nr:large subunit ribosomal protein L26e [Pancytospora philotis]
MAKSLTSMHRRKQRKALFTANMAEKRMIMSSHLSKELRAAYGFRSFPIHSQDVVVVTTGKFKGKEGKIESVNRMTRKVTVEGCTVAKCTGGTAFYPIDSSNLVIKELYMDADREKALISRKVIYDKTRAKYVAGK